MRGRRLAFWIAVGATSVFANFLVELAADKVPSSGLQRFAAYVHRGPGGSC